MVVGLSGYYGYRNAGDEAILEAIIRELKARGHDPLVFSARPEETAARYHVRAVSRTNPFAVWRAVRTVDLLLSGGGGLLQDRTSARSLGYYLAVIRLARAHGKPVWVFNQSLGPLSPRGEAWVRRALRDVPLILRDKASFQYARALGLNAHLGADPALLLEPPPAHREERLVVVVPRGKYPEANRTLLQAAQQLQSLGYEVAAVALQPHHDDDAIALFEGFTREAAWDPRRARYLFAQAGYVLSVRLHGLILAAAGGTPYAGLSYDPKVRAFCEETGAPCWPLPGDASALVRCVEERCEPTWPWVQAMKERAASSFEAVLGSRIRTSNGS